MSAFIDEHRARFGVEPIYKVLGVSASAYYQRATGARSDRAVADQRLLGQIREVHAANYYAYGYRRTWKALLRAGETVGRDHDKRLMRREGIQGAKRRGKPWRTTTPDLRAIRAPDLADRDFTASRPDELWVADFTYQHRDVLALGRAQVPRRRRPQRDRRHPTTLTKPPDAHRPDTPANAAASKLESPRSIAVKSPTMIDGPDRRRHPLAPRLLPRLQPPAHRTTPS